ncbi:MAG TPA: hypothetical protein DDW33_16075 [Ktedonobacter sp.]|nr:hypothetical protein [Ktedonobacter sp.]
MSRSPFVFLFCLQLLSCSRGDHSGTVQVFGTKQVRDRDHAPACRGQVRPAASVPTRQAMDCDVAIVGHGPVRQRLS